MKKYYIITILITIIATFIIYLECQNNLLEVNYYCEQFMKFPYDFKDNKVMQISDFHSTKSEKLTEQIIAEARYLKPKFIFITGDLIDSKDTEIKTAITFVKNLPHESLKFFVPGNHEASSDLYPELKRELKKLGVTILEDRYVVHYNGDTKINIVGLSDPSMEHNPYLSDEEIIKSKLDSLNYDKNNYTILLTHRPELFETYAEYGIDLVFAGHAHGGQIRIPKVGGLIAPNQGFFPKYTEKRTAKGKTSMIVSRGIGNSIIPCRINNRPEVIIYKLNFAYIIN